MNPPRLIKLWPPILYVENFLNSHFVSIQFSDHRCHALGINAPVEPAAFVNVVRGDANSGTHC